MSALHQPAPFPNGVYWQSYLDVFASDQCVTNSVSPILARIDVCHRAILESHPESRVSSQPHGDESPCSFPKATPIPYLPPADAALYSSKASTPREGDAPVPLRTSSQRRSPNHVPRPLNCFFLFKTDWLAKRKSLLAGIEQDHRQLNRMASSEWRKLPPEAKQRFKDAAYQAKVEHSIKYPGYRFTPKPRGDRRKRKTKRNEPEILLRNEEAARLVSQGVTGDALHETLAEYDRRSAEEKRNPSANASFPPSSEGLPCASPDSSSISPSSPSFDINQTHSRASQPTTFFDLEALWDTFTGNSQSVPWVGDVALSNYSSIVDQPQAVAAEPAHDSHSFHFDHLLDGYASLISPLYDHSTQNFQIDQQLQRRIDDLSLNQDPPISGTQGLASFPAFQSFAPNSGFGQSTSDPSRGSAYQSVPLFQANNFFHASSPMTYFAPL